MKSSSRLYASNDSNTPIEESTSSVMKNSDNHIYFEDFLVRTVTMHCEHKGHQLDRIDAILYCYSSHSDSIKEVHVKAGYCKQCGKYYVENSEYERIKRMNMIILCKIVDNTKQTNAKGIYANFAQESISHMYGYNVSSTGNNVLTEKNRHDI